MISINIDIVYVLISPDNKINIPIINPVQQLIIFGNRLLTVRIWNPIHLPNKDFISDICYFKK